MQTTALRARRFEPCQSLSAASFKLWLDISGQEGCPCESREGMNLKRQRGAIVSLQQNPASLHCRGTCYQQDSALREIITA